MKKIFIISTLIIFLITSICFIIFLSNCSRLQQKGIEKMGIDKRTQETTIRALIDKFDESQKESIEIGVRQVANLWKKSDGSKEEFQKFCLDNFTVNPQEKDIIFTRFQNNLEALLGNLHKIDRQFKWALDVEKGDIYPLDYLFGFYNTFAHVNEDLFKNKLAFVVLLNFPVYTLDEKNSDGLNWSRKKWAEARLIETQLGEGNLLFLSRVPADVSQNHEKTYTKADNYISNYNIYMHNLLDEGSNRIFPKGLKLISHWGLRDELKAQYANPDGFSRQKLIQKVMERIILQEIPQAVINSDKHDWNPYSNKIFMMNSQEETSSPAEPNTRYQQIWDNYQAELLLDPYFPQAPTLIDRRFKINREMSEEDVEGLLTSVLSAPILKDIAQLISKRLGRSLEPFDIWYNGFKPTSHFTEEELDKKVGKLYPSVAAFQEDLPYILRKIGFNPSKAEFLSQHIQVDPSRGVGHAMGAMMREDKAHLRTRIPESGMKYKGFNIAIHELGHNVEQVFSLSSIDYYTLTGVPNTAFTEAFAFVFQSRDLEILGLNGASKEAEDLRSLNDLWATFEISGVSLLDMYLWRWMYEHPNAGAEQLKNAMTEISRNVWNTYFAPVIGIQDQILLAIYSHIISRAMYTPDYPLGHIISFQIEQYLKDHLLATEMERMCRLGRLTPQVWMQQAVGEKISTQPLLKAAEAAMQNLNR